jgi:hypothetical protein
MNNIEIIKAIAYLKPNAEYTFNEDDYSTIKWLKLEGEAPTLAELKTALEQVLANAQAEAETKATAKAAAQSKLAALGLTVDDLAALGL